MGTINIPLPSNPKSPQGDQEPLQPGGPVDSRSNAPDPTRPNYQPPDEQKEKRDNR
jgi:hypothetical protein